MVNRKLIRIKTLQAVYAHRKKSTDDLRAAEKELLESLNRSYDLYHLLLLLPVALTRQYERRTAFRRQKFVPTAEDLNPNTRLLTNRFVAKLTENVSLLRYTRERSLSWDSDEAATFVRLLLEQMLASPLYKAYAEGEEDDFQADKQFWNEFFYHFICHNEEFDAYLEEKSIYWNDDVHIVESFIIKTIKKIHADSGPDMPLEPMYTDEDCREFALRLLSLTVLHAGEYSEYINRQLTNWDPDRIADVDLIILQMAVAEIINFPSIPVNVSLNEYIELAKYYGTPKSSTFVNGILDAVVRELREEKLIPFKG
jgi:N utilization substance protein B